jgi:hypothetical protein
LIRSMFRWFVSLRRTHACTHARSRTHSIIIYICLRSLPRMAQTIWILISLSHITHAHVMHRTHAARAHAHALLHRIAHARTRTACRAMDRTIAMRSCKIRTARSGTSRNGSDRILPSSCLPPRTAPACLPRWTAYAAWDAGGWIRIVNVSRYLDRALPRVLTSRVVVSRLTCVSVLPCRAMPRAWIWGQGSMLPRCRRYVISIRAHGSKPGPPGPAWMPALRDRLMPPCIDAGAHRAQCACRAWGLCVHSHRHACSHMLALVPPPSARMWYCCQALN